MDFDIYDPAGSGGSSFKFMTVQKYMFPDGSRMHCYFLFFDYFIVVFGNSHTTCMEGLQHANLIILPLPTPPARLRVCTQQSSATTTCFLKQARW